MRSLWIRLLFSHVLVAVIAGVTAYLLVPLLTPVLFSDEPPGVPAGANRPHMREAVRQSLLLGTLLGTAAGVAFGGFATFRLGHSLNAVRRATRQIAGGRYDVRVDIPDESELAALAGDVNRMATALAELETRRVRLMGEIAHELRAPLAILTAEVEGMIDGVLPIDPDRLASLAEELQRLGRLADDLAELSRAEGGHLPLRPTRIDVRALAAGVRERFATRADAAGIRLLLEPGDPVVADADPDRLGQVLRNLVANAIRATPAGGEVRVRVDGGAAVSIAVSDTGVGLDEVDLKRVFERFYRARGGEAGDGSGVGLTIARQLMRAHGGDLVASSPGAGRGARFTATLPGPTGGIMDP